MEAIETFELRAENAIPITEKRCYIEETKDGNQYPQDLPSEDRR